MTLKVLQNHFQINKDLKMDKNQISAFEIMQRMDKRLTNIENLLPLTKTVLNIDEVERLTSLSKSTIYKLTCRGGIPHYKKAKHLFFDRVEIESWLKSNRIKPQEEIEAEAINYTTKNGGGVR